MPPYVHPDAWDPCGPEDGGGSYPFLSPSGDVRRLVADLALTVDPGPAGLTPPLRLSWAYGLGAAFPSLAGLPSSPPAGLPTPPDEPDGWAEPARTPTHAVDVVVRDALDAVVFDSTAATSYAASDHGPYLRVHRWAGPSGSLRLAQRTRFPDEASAWAVPAEVRPGNGVLDPRCWSSACRRVTAVAVEGGPTLSGAVTLRPGYNAAFSATPTALSGVVRSSSFSVAATSGAGEGRTPCDAVDPAPTVASLGGATADARGRIRLAGDACYRVLPVVADAGDGTALLTPGLVAVQNHCGPCCSCAGYVALAAAAARGHARLVALAASLEASRDGMAAAGARWSALLPPSGAPPVQVHVRALAFDVRFVDLAVSVCNRADACLPTHQFNLVVTPPEGSGMVPTIVQDGCSASIVCGEERPALVVDPPASGERPYALRAFAGQDHVLSLRFDEIQPRSTAVFRLRWEFSNVLASTPRPVVITHVGTADSTTVFVPPRPAT